MVTRDDVGQQTRNRLVTFALFIHNPDRIKAIGFNSSKQPENNMTIPEPEKLFPPIHRHELSVAIQASALAGERLRQMFGNVQSNETKFEAGESVGLVTEADLQAERAILETLQSEFPRDGYFSEEDVNRSTAGHERLWIIDPLDGTHNFAHAIPHFAISIALHFDNQVQGGVVHNPLSDDWFVAWRGSGAWHNGRQVHVRGTEDLTQAMIATGFYYDRGSMMEATLQSINDLFRQNIRGIRRFGAAALDLCWVGCGRFDGFFEYRLAPWDFAAGSLFVEEAGGKTSNCQGLPLGLANSSILASNGHLHETLQAIISKNWQDPVRVNKSN
jgi:myo-inositol-1(or 4)-monophosphatase